MLEQINLTKKMEKSVYQEKMEVMEPQLSKLQRECKALGIPVIIAFEGLGAAGKRSGKGGVVDGACGAAGVA